MPQQQPVATRPDGVSGAPKSAPRLQRLRDAGLYDKLLAAGVSRNDLRWAELLLGFAQTTDLVGAAGAIGKFAQTRARRTKPISTILKTLHRSYTAAGIAPNPVVIPPPAHRAPQLGDFSEETRRDLLRLREYLVAQNFSRDTKVRAEELALRAARWISQHSSEGLAAFLATDSCVYEYAKSCARPTPTGMTPSFNTFKWTYAFLTYVWRSTGLSADEAKEKLSRLQRTLRRDGTARLVPDLLDLRPPSPEPAPDPEAFASYLATLDAEIRHQREAKNRSARMRLVGLLTERALVLTAVLTGARAASLTSMRADQIHLDANDVLWIEVIVKSTPKRHREPPTPRRRIGDQWYAMWPLPATLLNVYQELFEAHGLDLVGYLRSGDRSKLKWVRLDEDATFGRIAPVGTQVAPLWLDRRGSGYLKRSRMKAIFTRIARKRLNLPRGCMHIFRRLAAFNYRELSVRNPGLVEMLLQMSPAQQVLYSLPIQQDLRRAIGTFDLATGQPSQSLVTSLARREPSQAFPRQDVATAASGSAPSRSHARPEFKFADLFGE